MQKLIEQTIREFRGEDGISLAGRQFLEHWAPLMAEQITEVVQKENWRAIKSAMWSSL